MSIRLGFIGATSKLSVATSAATFTAPDVYPKRLRYILLADAATVHIARNTVATNNDFILPANTLVEIDLFAGETLSYKTSASTANLYITQKEG